MLTSLGSDPALSSAVMRLRCSQHLGSHHKKAMTGMTTDPDRIRWRAATNDGCGAGIDGCRRARIQWSLQEPSQRAKDESSASVLR